MLAWLRCVAGPNALLRAVAVFDDLSLVGIAPFVAKRRTDGGGHYRLLGAGTSMRIEPLAKQNQDLDIGRVIGKALAGLDPRPTLVEFEGIPLDSPWPEAIASGWQDERRPRLYRLQSMPAPTLSVRDQSFDEWFATRRRSFKNKMHRARRKFEEYGAAFRVATQNELESDLSSFARLHHSRWKSRGGSGVLSDEVERMLSNTGKRLVEEGRFRLSLLEINNAPVAAQIVIAAGGEAAAWLSGFDESWADLNPSFQTMLAAIEGSFKNEDVRFDLGAGGQDYKYLFADGEDTLVWIALVPRSRGSTRVRLELAYRHLRKRLSARLPPKLRAALKHLLRP
jgi:CelD/BcsL family acetyltransferase involved in cellulose biosynthesis